MKRERKNKLFTTILIFALCTAILPQMGILTIKEAKASENPTTEWTQTYGGTDNDYAYAIIEASAGGYAIAGSTLSFGAGDRDFWLVRTDVSGNMQWNMTYGGADRDYGYDVVETFDGGFAVAGYTRSFGAGDYDAWLVKADASGNMLWNKTYGGFDTDRAYALVQTSDNGFAMVGYTETWGAGEDDAWLVKVDASGVMQWNMTYGGVEDEHANALVQTSDGGYAIIGYTTSFGAGGFDVWLVKADASGNMQWNMTYGGAGDEEGTYLVETTDGDFVVAGFTGSFGAGDYDAWLVRTDASGNMQWNKTYGGMATEYAYPVVETDDGGFAIAGRTESYGAGGRDVWLVETDDDGNMLWNQTWGGTDLDQTYAMIETSDGGYAIGAYSSSFSTGGDADFWLIKVSVDHVALPVDVGVVVDYGDGSYDHFDVEVTPPANSALDALVATGLSVDEVGGVVNGINGVDPADPGWWTLWIWTADGWEFSSLDAASLMLEDDAIIGWRVDPDLNIQPTMRPINPLATGAPDTTMTLSTPPSYLPMHATFTVDLRIADAVDACQWGIRNLMWDPAVLNLTDISFGDFIPETCIPLYTPINYTHGILAEASMSSLSDTETSGDGLLVTFTFETVGYGSTNIVIAGIAVQINADNVRDHVQTFSTTYTGLSEPVPSGPTARITVPGNDVFVVVGTSFTLDASDSLPGDDGTGTAIPIDSYQWNITGPSFSQNFTGAEPGDITLTNIGDYYFNLTVTAGAFNASVVHIVHVLEVPVGAVVDVYTNRGGQLANASSDAFGPQELVELFANVTYNGGAMVGNDVAFEIRNSEGTLIAIRTGKTNSDGVATASYRVPWPASNPDCTFGTWCVEATAEVSETACYDKVCFEFGYILEIVSVETLHPLAGTSMTEVGRLEDIDVKVSVQNIRKIALTGKVCISLYDVSGTPHQCVTFDLTVPAQNTVSAAFTVTIPGYAFVGLGTVYNNVLTSFPSLGGVPYCLEDSITIDITL